jgi:hypothetical protein
LKVKIEKFLIRGKPIGIQGVIGMLPKLPIIQVGDVGYIGTQKLYHRAEEGEARRLHKQSSSQVGLSSLSTTHRTTELHREIIKGSL